MKILRFLLQKEFKQIFRNKTILRMIIALPIVQLIVLPLAADYEIKNINIAIVDNDQSPYSRLLISKIESSGYFILTGDFTTYESAYHQLESDEADLVLEIPYHFEKNLSTASKEDLFLAINAINGTKDNVGGAYLQRIIGDFNQEVRLEWISPTPIPPMPQIEVSTLNRFNFPIIIGFS